MVNSKMSSRVRSSCGRRAGVRGTGKLAKIDVALSKWEEYQVKLLGEQLRKDGPCRGLDSRAAKSVSRLAEFQTKDRMLQWIDEVLAGQRARKPKPAKTAREHRRGEGNSRA
jgi:hypothetical protein